MKKICSITFSFPNSSQSESTQLILYNPKATDIVAENKALVKSLKNEGFLVSDVMYGLGKSSFIQFFVGTEHELTVGLQPPIDKYLKKNGSCYEFKIDKLKTVIAKAQKKYDEAQKLKTIAQFRFPMLLAYLENEMNERKIEFTRDSSIALPSQSDYHYFRWNINKYNVSLYLPNKLLSTIKFENVKCAVEYKDNYFDDIPFIGFLNKPNINELIKSYKEIVKSLKSEKDELDNAQKELNKKFYQHNTKLNKKEKQKIREIYGK